MPKENHFCVVELAALQWPPSIPISSRRFRVFVAADVTGIVTEVISKFANAALKTGMVYFCAWGPGCERFHDIVDEVITEDDLGERLFAGPKATDTVMTTWHDSEELGEALEFFINFAHPTDGFEDSSEYWVAVCVNNSEWAETVRRILGTAELRR
jgi:hypothetical protein